MAQIDRLLAALAQPGARELQLHEGEVAMLVTGNTMQPLTRAALTGAQLAGLLMEVAGPDEAAAISARAPVTIRRVTDAGEFVLRGSSNGGGWRLTAQRAGGAAAQGTAASAPSNGVAAPPARDGALAQRSPAAPTPSASAEVGASDIQEALAAIRGFEGSEKARVRLDDLLRDMVRSGASDLHLRVNEPPILRRDGEMHRLDQVALSAADLAAMTRSIMPERNRIEFAESNDTDFAHEVEGCARFRANVARDRNGPVAVFRQIPATVVTVEQMNVPEEVRRLCYLTKGLVLVTGPTGSGKSTTLCALIDLVNRSRSDHIITIEDPIEFVHPNKKCIITQRQVGVHTKSFKSALRAALREDPDIVLVGEMRDLETVSIALETAETGHLVFGTLHTTTAAGTIDRIIDQFPADRQAQVRVMLAESLKGVISQTLCRKIGGGRVAAREILLSVPSITNLIREGKTFQIPSVMQTSKRLGMVTLNDALIAHVDTGIVEPREAYMKAVEKVGFVQMLKTRGLDVSFAEGEAEPGRR